MTRNRRQLFAYMYEERDGRLLRSLKRRVNKDLLDLFREDIFQPLAQSLWNNVYTPVNIALREWIKNDRLS